MKIDDLANAVTMEEAMRQIKLRIPVEDSHSYNNLNGNKTFVRCQSMLWITVKTSSNCLVEFGGYVEQNGTLFLKVYVPKYKDGLPVQHVWKHTPNHNVQMNYAIEFFEETGRFSVEYPGVFMRNKHRKSLDSVEKFCSFVDERDWVNDPVKISYRSVEMVVIKEKKVLNI